MTPELKPCPACECATTKMVTDCLLRDGTYTEWAVHCVGCRLIGPTRVNRESAERSWNALPRRATGAEFDELREALAAWRRAWSDLYDGSSCEAMRVRRAIDAVLAAAPQQAPCCGDFANCHRPCVERGRRERDEEVKVMRSEVEKLRAEVEKLRAFRDAVVSLHNGYEADAREHLGVKEPEANRG